MLGYLLLRGFAGAIAPSTFRELLRLVLLVVISILSDFVCLGLLHVLPTF